MSAGLPVRVLLVDDHQLFRECLRRVLEANASFQVVAEAASLSEVLALLDGGAAFDLALIDLQLNTQDHAADGLAVLETLRRTQPATASVLLTAGAERDQLRHAIQTLAASVFLKSEPISDLFVAMDRTLQGRVWVSSGANLLLLEEPAATPEPATAEASFTARELLVLRWITEGLSNKEIASQLTISEASVKALLQTIFKKTSVRTRSQVVRYVFECGLFLP